MRTWPSFNGVAVAPLRSVLIDPVAVKTPWGTVGVGVGEGVGERDGERDGVGVAPSVDDALAEGVAGVTAGVAGATEQAATTRISPIAPSAEPGMWLHDAERLRCPTTSRTSPRPVRLYLLTCIPPVARAPRPIAETVCGVERSFRSLAASGGEMLIGRGESRSRERWQASTGYATTRPQSSGAKCLDWATPMTCHS